MTMTCHAFIATSLDGFIARTDGSIDWLENANVRIPAGEDCGYQEFFSQMDCIMLGRKTFQTVSKFPQWPYADKQTIVMTRSGLCHHDLSVTKKIEFSNQSLKMVLTRLHSLGFQNVYVDGGLLIQSFLNEGLLTDITITRIPVLLGKGISLFGTTTQDIGLRLIESRHWSFGFVQDKYQIVNS